MSMDIYAKKGVKVKFILDREPLSWGVDNNNAKYLTLNQSYTIERTDVHSWHTKVYLQEIPNIPFSSIWFDEV
jgi:hypothetical protein